MKLDIKNKIKISEQFFSRFNSNHMILFAGTNVNDSVLSQALCGMPWSCVITTSKSKSFADRFQRAGRNIIDMDNLREISRIPLDKKNLSIIRLMGIEGKEDNEEREELLELGLIDSKQSYDQANNFLKKLPGILEGFKHMYIVGYDPSLPEEYPYIELGGQLYYVQNTSVSFFGIAENNRWYKKIQLLANKKEFNLYEDELAEIIEDEENPYSYDSEDYYSKETAENEFYKGGESINIDSSDLIQTRAFVSLLTEQLVYSFRPYGKIRQKEAFCSFLEDSASKGPQWYGYLPNSLFYIKRTFEDPLVGLVRRALSGMAPGGKYSSVEPIILEGRPGTSKSITLGALAYRIYNERINPVIFIKDSKIFFNNYSMEFESLLNLMQQIDNLGKNVKTLLIWDCSSHENVHNSAKKLARDLENKGRSFVLVCSSYDIKNYNETDNGFKWYEENGVSEFRKTKENADVYKYDGCYIVPSSRDITSAEKNKIKSNFRDFADIPYSASCWKKLDEEASDIFSCFYAPISLLRHELEGGLSREKRQFETYVNEHLYTIRKNIGLEEKPIPSMEYALKKSGFDLSEFGISEKDFVEKEEINEKYNFDAFDTCVALFSIFKLDAPAELALNMLYYGREKEDIYTTKSGRAIFENLTTRNPWIYYGENINGDYIFRYKNPIEAQYHLKEFSDSEQQLEIVCEMIRYYAENYKKTLLINVNLAKQIQTLLKCVGPNSENKFLFDNSAFFANNLDKIIDELYDLRTINGVPDIDASFVSTEVTFLREYYSNIFKVDDTNKNEISKAEKYELKLDSLSEAIELAKTFNEQIEIKIKSLYGYTKRYAQTQQISLTVELTHCNLAAEQIRIEYLEFCTQNNIEPKQKWVNQQKFILPYRETFKLLESSINKDPSNGYTYVALFKLFKNEYKRENLPEEVKLQYLSEILVIIDNTDEVEIYNRGSNGRDDFGELVAEIMELTSKNPVTIDDIINQNPEKKKFLLQYENCKETRNPSAIMYVCKRELTNVGITIKNSDEEEKLTADQIRVCKKIKAFMERSENFECIKQSSYALSMLFKITWMICEKKKFSPLHECQTTHIQKSEWQDINRICGYYCGFENARPSIILIYALSTLQVTGNYAACYKILKSIDDEKFYVHGRMKVPFIYSDSDGNPYEFSGTVISLTSKGDSCFIDVDDLPKRFGSDVGVRCSKNSLGGKIPNKAYRYTKNLELGIRYTGFTMYTKERSHEKRGYKND